jgi:hypothetical protein
MKEALAAGLALIASFAGSVSGQAQSAAATTATTRILAIRSINPGVDQAQVLAILPNEVRVTVSLYLEGKIDQWRSLQDRPGVGSS